MSLADALAAALGSAPPGLTLRPEQREAFLQHAELLKRWNRVHNLTRVTDDEEVARAHFVDSLAGLSAIASHLGASPAGALVDVGSGGGFPGLVAAVLWPEVQVTLVESVHKKASFLRHAARHLSLPNVRVEPQRVESLGLEAELVTTRATFPWPQLAGLVPLLREGGSLCAWVGHAPSAGEWTALCDSAGLIGARRLTYEVPGLPARAVAFGSRPR